VHEDGLKLAAPPSEDEKLTVPVGELPVTVAEQVVEDPIVTGEQETETDELACPTLKLNLLELLALLLSPL
jgi:hypothetical protein